MEMSKTHEADSIMNVHITIGEPIGAGMGTITAKDLTQEKARAVSEQIRQRLVEVDPAAPSCCIDGRCAKCTMAAGEAANELEPRPSVSGGGNITAYAAAEWAGYFGVEDNRPSAEKLADIDSKLRSQGLNSGAHGDTKAAAHQFSDPENPEKFKTGCGAGDKFVEIMGIPYDEPDVVTPLVQQLLGDAFDTTALARLPKQQVAEHISSWDPRDNIELTAGVSDGKNVEILDGSHGELLVVFNFVDNTTLDRDALVKETGDQVFVVDMWYLDKLAQALAAGRPDAEEMYGKLKHQMVAYQIATYLALCDGTQRPVILTEPAADLVA